MQRLRAGWTVTDRDWDRLYPRWARAPSRIHWTPVEVARRAAELLVDRPGARVLDVGSGVGKFCMVGALSTRGVFTGVEQRPHLREVARQVARAHAIERCAFLLGDVTRIDWRDFDAFYLFNPFAEQLPGQTVIDERIDARPDRFDGYVRAVERWFAALPPGARMATYHGFGGRMPDGWVESWSEPRGGGRLELWVKAEQPALEQAGAG